MYGTIVKLRIKGAEDNFAIRLKLHRSKAIAKVGFKAICFKCPIECTIRVEPGNAVSDSIANTRIRTANYYVTTRMNNGSRYFISAGAVFASRFANTSIGRGKRRVYSYLLGLRMRNKPDCKQKSNKHAHTM